VGIQHTKRSLRASTIVDEYCALTGEYNCLESTITDLITDLLHLAHREGMEANSICQMAAIHVSAETDCCLQGGA
jgi:hypothetical protein